MRNKEELVKDILDLLNNGEAIGKNYKEVINKIGGRIEIGDSGWDNSKVRIDERDGRKFVMVLRRSLSSGAYPLEVAKQLITLFKYSTLLDVLEDNSKALVIEKTFYEAKDYRELLEVAFMLLVPDNIEYNFNNKEIAKKYGIREQDVKDMRSIVYYG